MAPAQTKDYLIELFPAFEAEWVDSLYLNEDGSYTNMGILMEFGTYFRDNVGSISDKKLEVLFADFEKLVRERDRSEQGDPIAGAICASFLEGIAHEGLTDRIRPFIGPECLTYYERYDY